MGRVTFRSLSAVLAASLISLPACAGAGAEGSGGDAGAELDGGGVSDASSAYPDPGDDGGLPGADGAVSLDASPVSCATTFTFVPDGRRVGRVAVTGEWNGFAADGVALVGPDARGAYSADVEIPAGVVAYALVVDGALELDPEAALRKYAGGVERSAVRVADCHAPLLVLADKAVTRVAAGSGRFRARVVYRDGHDRRGLDPASLTVTLARDGATRPVQSAPFDAARSIVDLDLPALADGKYTAIVTAKDRAGHAALPLRLVFWIEPSPFEWRDAVIYMVMTDRFQNGDPSNDAPKVPGVDPRVDYRGGDFQGVTARIEDGTFDRLGVRALWLSPFHENPRGAYAADDGTHQVTGYHGYWPVKARAVDPRIGGEAGLHAMVTAAHAHGIRVLQDFVVNHVHEQHEYFTQHPAWFRTGCVCGTAGCDWTAHRLDCLFSPYLPDVNWSVPEVSEAYGDDAVWWLETFDLDGLRIDAVKHVEDAAVMNLTARIRGELEAAGTRVFLTGETAMGWSDCGLACNEEQYATIRRYIGPHGLDGQLDFVLYHGVSYRTFARGEKGMLHADYWAQASAWEYPAGAIMTPYLGSQDTSRFVTLASYRGQDPSHGTDVPDHKWTDYAGPPAPGDDAYARQRLAMTWLLTLPGAPLLYYGDEYGEWGGGDPNNRPVWRGGGGTLSPEEAATLARTRALGTARRELVALRRGAYRSLLATEDQLVFARQAEAGQTAIVALTRSAAAETLVVPLPVTLPFAEGAILKDRLGGPDVTVTGGVLRIPLGARGAAVLAP
jgi:glycosidase